MATAIIKLSLTKILVHNAEKTDISGENWVFVNLSPWKIFSSLFRSGVVSLNHCNNIWLLLLSFKNQTHSRTFHRWIFNKLTRTLRPWAFWWRQHSGTFFFFFFTNFKVCCGVFLSGLGPVCPFWCFSFTPPETLFLLGLGRFSPDSIF